MFGTVEALLFDLFGAACAKAWPVSRDDGIHFFPSSCSLLSGSLSTLPPFGSCAAPGRAQTSLPFLHLLPPPLPVLGCLVQHL